MSTQTFVIKYEKNGETCLTPNDIRRRYFFGIPLVDDLGNSLADDIIQFYISSAQLEVENFLSIKFKKQVFRETGAFNYNHWKAWGYVPLVYPLLASVSLQGFLNTTLQIDYPPEWLSNRRTSDDGLGYRIMNLVPITGSPNTLAGNILFTGIAPDLSYFGNDQIPNYWEITYITGFENVPEDILNVTGKLASINLFHMMGDIIIGAGIGQKSISIDGLSQSINTTASATTSGYSGRIKGYLHDLATDIPRLKSRYRGISWGVA